MAKLAGVIHGKQEHADCHPGECRHHDKAKNDCKDHMHVGRVGEDTFWRPYEGYDCRSSTDCPHYNEVTAQIAKLQVSLVRLLGTVCTDDGVVRTHHGLDQGADHDNLLDSHL